MHFCFVFYKIPKREIHVSSYSAFFLLLKVLDDTKTAPFIIANYLNFGTHRCNLLLYKKFCVKKKQLISNHTIIDGVKIIGNFE